MSRNRQEARYHFALILKDFHNRISRWYLDQGCSEIVSI